MSLLYDELASWWQLMSPLSEYVEEAGFYAGVLKDAAELEARSVLELGSGGGHNAFHMKQWFGLTLVDVAPGMLAVSRALNPQCEHVEGDMRTVRLGRQFDRVFVHDAVCYMASEDDLLRAMTTAFVHCKPGGAVVFAPDHVRETFEPSTDHGGSDGPARAMRYLEWTHDPDPNDMTYTVDYTFVLREANGSVRVEHERHVEGLFSRAVWLRLLAEVGFEADRVSFAHSEVERELDLFVGRRPPAS